MRPQTIVINQAQAEYIRVKLIGSSAYMGNAMSTDAAKILLVGSARPTDTEKQRIKNHPFKQFRESLRIDEDFNPHTDVFHPGAAFKRAMREAAINTGGVKATECDRLLRVVDENVPIYGTPSLRIDRVRDSGIGKTPNLRAHAFFPHWATELTIQYMAPNFDKTKVVNLLSNAGLFIGVGDGRQGLGKMSFGCFEVFHAGDGEMELPSKLLDLDRQREALRNPAPTNAFSEIMLKAYIDECGVRDLPIER